MTFRIILFILFSFKVSANDCVKPQMPTEDEWNKWLDSPHIQLGYQPPRDLMGSIIGRRLIKQIINRLRYSFMA